MSRVRNRQSMLVGLAVGAAVLALGSTGATASGTGAAGLGRPVTPIKHVIVIIGENHTFDNVFGTYQPPRGQSVMNLLSEGIVTASGEPGPNASPRRPEPGKRHARLPTRPNAHGCLSHAAAAEYDIRLQGV